MAKRKTPKKPTPKDTTKPKNKGGRPTMYTPQLAEKICIAIATSTYGIATICKNNPGFPCEWTVHKWLREHEEFSQLYADAKSLQAGNLIDESTEIADDSSGDTITITLKSGETKDIENREWTSRSKLRVEHRRWLAERLDPKRFGNKVDITSDGKRLPKSQNIQLTPELIKTLAENLESKT